MYQALLSVVPPLRPPPPRPVRSFPLRRLSVVPPDNGGAGRTDDAMASTGAPPSVANRPRPSRPDTPTLSLRVAHLPGLGEKQALKRNGAPYGSPLVLYNDFDPTACFCFTLLPRFGTVLNVCGQINTVA